MRVGFDARWFNGYGVGTYVSQLLNSLAELSNQFELVIFEDAGNPVPLAEGRKIARVAVRSSRFSVRSQFELRELCESNRIDLFHLPFQYGAPLFLSCPLVITVHDLTPFLFRTRSWGKQFAIVPFVKLGVRAAVARAAHIIAVSRATANDLQHVLNVRAERITTILNAAAERHFHPLSGSAAQLERDCLSKKYGIVKPYVVVSSAANWRTKNLETALRALAMAREISGMNFQTVVCGPSQGLNVLVRRNAARGLDICPTGYLPIDDLAAMFRNAELFIFPSLYEGFGLPILEAMSCGCAVVTSNGGALAEIADEGAQVFNPMDARGMAQAVARLLQRADDREHWQQRALVRAADFSWRKAAEQTLSVYRKVLEPASKKEPEIIYADESHDAGYQKVS